MLITTFFTEIGVPKTGLSPIILIVDADSVSTIISNDPMVEIGSGWYKYEFALFDPVKNYTIRCDGGAVIYNDYERYTYATNHSSALIDSQLNIIQDTNTKIGTMPADIWSVDKSTITTANSIGEYILKKVLNLTRFIGFHK